MTTCVMCNKGTLSPGKVTVTHEKGTFFIAIRDVPARVCDHCGHYFLAAPIALRVESAVKQAMTNGVDVEVMRLQAA
ncbi:MAG: type II toxin-antitoxin system MqsA family antitoxin [Phycisphaerae bacterium]|nr:type II toxin-antitoxin system MqsA family antitoxin [Saprospiraceae bacterium]